MSLLMAVILWAFHSSDANSNIIVERSNGTGGTMTSRMIDDM